MSLGLPLAAYILILLALRARGSGWRAAMIGAAVVWGVMVVLITELLSLLRGLTPMNLALAWLAVDGAALVYGWHASRNKSVMKEHLGCGVRPRQVVVSLLTMKMLWLWGLAVIVALAAIVALCSPPNTTDAMTYHMPRVMHWVQQRNLAFYPTGDLRQLHMPPWTEFAILHIHLLWGGDRFDPLVQWFSFLGSIVGVSLLAQRLGAGPRGQVLAAMVCATIPEGILQASAVKNDYVVAFWCVALAYYLLAYRRQPTWAHALGIGGALGLAWLTKGTAYVFSFALLLTWVLAWPWRSKLVWLRHVLPVLFLAVGINAGHFVRNYSLYGSPLGPEADLPPATFKYRNDALTVSTLVSNSLRNLALHVGTPLRSVNTTLEQGIAATIHAIGDEVNNPQTTWSGSTFHIPEMSRHEAVAGNPLHLVLIGLTLVMLLSREVRQRSTTVAIAAAALVLAFVLFCALLRWTPWATRLHLPLFVLWAGLIGVMLGQVRSRAVIFVVSLLLLLQAFPVALSNQLRPLVFGGAFNILSQERDALYFADRRDLLDAYRAATELIQRQRCRHVGLDAPVNSFEYPILAWLGVDRGERSVTHIGVQNLSARYQGEDGGVGPCAVICLSCTTVLEKWKAYTTRVGPGTIIEDLVVFRARGPSPTVHDEPRQPPPCIFTFATGWHAREQSGQDWWRWSEGRGNIHVVTTTDGDVVLVGQLRAVQAPNTVDLLLNGAKAVTWEITENALQPFKPARLSLEAGQHSLVFASHKPATRIPGDGRSLAFAARNLLIVSADGAALCELQP